MAVRLRCPLQDANPQHNRHEENTRCDYPGSGGSRLAIGPLNQIYCPWDPYLLRSFPLKVPAPADGVGELGSRFSPALPPQR